MKAIVYKQYGSPKVLQFSNIEKPIPKKNEILIKIKATAVNSGDVRLRKADPFAVRFIFGLLKPKIQVLGCVLAGEVESVGEGVSLFKVGDRVFGHTDMSFGTYAEYKCMPESGTIAEMPSQISFEEAAVIPFGGLTAFYFIQKANIQHGQKVLIYGASGAVGTAAIQLAKSLGAIVTGVCSTENMDLVRSLGADNVIDYKKEDFSKQDQSYDVILDTVNKIDYNTAIKSLNSNGVLILSAAGLTEMLKGFWTSFTSSKKVITGVVSHCATDILFLKEQIEAGILHAVIDRSYSLEEVSEAHAYVEKGHKKGNVAIVME